ncbi:splicing regulatory glutamine/lysine-rich protein 1-like isoform X2 [Palaemon carinicauda]|uniref:splicing regulatory glutamine/lysine-rich protein 1-like isoform X2 n=1 Tax=Palaemon carinicauda TaxID=392227 RepID=UPI0035B65C56
MQERVASWKASMTGLVCVSQDQLANVSGQSSSSVERRPVVSRDVSDGVYSLVIYMVSKVTAEELTEPAAKAGEFRYLRLGLECNGTKNALVESSEQPFVTSALKMHHQEFMGQPIKVNHSSTAIIKP